jgi:hypothetical protein
LRHAILKAPDQAIRGVDDDDLANSPLFVKPALAQHAGKRIVRREDFDGDIEWRSWIRIADGSFGGNDVRNRLIGRIELEGNFGARVISDAVQQSQ